jgi:hypothetical protein|tara:strand:- start:3968 stop:5194 length:1227 start_codon:yes stop_codon:yes gene_type:complete
MSLQKSRYESQSIVNSFNLFIDSGKAAIVGDGRSTGDNYLVHLGDNSIEAEDGEIIRLSLVNFNMFNNIFGVNLNNCKFRVTTDRTAQPGGGIEAGEVNIPRKNYRTVGAVALAFAQALGAALLAQSQAQGGTATAVTFGANNADVKPPVDTSLGGTDDRLIDITVTFDAAHEFAAGEVFVQCFRQVGDSFALLGALGLDSTPPDPAAPAPAPTENSFEITVPSTTTIRIQGYFPAQRTTDPNVYVRCASTQNGLESVVMSDPIGDTSTGRYQGEVLNSNVLAKIHRDSEFINFETGSSDEYFINLQQRKLSTLRIFLTDSRSRPLGRPFHSDTLNVGTASGLETGAGVIVNQKQNQNGNLFFDCVIKVEIIKVRNPRLLDTTPPPPPLPAREAQSVLTWQDYGRPRF